MIASIRKIKPHRRRWRILLAFKSRSPNGVKRKLPTANRLVQVKDKFIGEFSDGFRVGGEVAPVTLARVERRPLTADRAARVLPSLPGIVPCVDGSWVSRVIADVFQAGVAVMCPAYLCCVIAAVSRRFGNWP